MNVYQDIETAKTHFLRFFPYCRKTAMNFNPPMCRAGKVCIAEVEEVVEIDEIPPGEVN